MGKLSVKIKIGDREYPMKVDAEDEAKIRKAGKLINEKIKVFRGQFGIDDWQDLLAMVTFDSVVEQIDVSNKYLKVSTLSQKLDKINKQIATEI